MKTLILLNILFWSAISTTFGATTHVFLIHGINSNTERTFVDMPKALDKVLHKRSNRDYIIRTFDYDTGSDSLGTYDFAESFNNFLIDHFMKEGFNPDEDKISIVGHSQGGLVSILWLNQSFNGRYSTDFHQYVDTFISLGSPFWGTSITLFPIWMTRTFGKAFGRIESIEMLWGSHTTDYLQKELNTPSSKFYQYLEGINVVNVGGNALGYPNTATFNRMMDDDIAVPISSSNLNYYYTNDDVEHYRSGRVIASEKKTKLSQYFVVNGLHTSLSKISVYKWLRPLQGMAQIPKRCIKNEYCDHMAYEYVWKGLLHLPMEQKDKRIVRKTTSFSIDLDLKLDHPNITPKEFEFEFRNADGSRLDRDVKLTVLYDREEDDYYDAATSNVRFIFAGRAKDGHEHKLLMKVNHKGNRFLAKSYKITVAPQKTTFIKGRMARFNDSL